MYRDENYDPFTKVGLIRIIVAKHNKSDDIYKTRVTLISHEIFCLGFVCNVGEDRRPQPAWLDEEWDTNGRDVTESLLDKEANGLYEITGNLYHTHSYTSGYEYPEYDSEMDVREHNIQKIDYDNAYCMNKDHFEDEEIKLTKLVDSTSSAMDWDCEVHHYMLPLQILQHQANALCAIMDQFWNSARVNTKEMTIDECETFIHMCMLDIDSESEQDPKKAMRNNLAKKIDEAVQQTIEIHKELFE